MTLSYRTREGSGITGARAGLGEQDKQEQGPIHCSGAARWKCSSEQRHAVTMGPATNFLPHPVKLVSPHNILPGRERPKEGNRDADKERRHNARDAAFTLVATAQ